MSTRKHAQIESCKLSFIWGKMRTAAWETAPQLVNGRIGVKTESSGSSSYALTTRVEVGKKV